MLKPRYFEFHVSRRHGVEAATCDFAYDRRHFNGENSIL
jgi:hypothetical protein